VASLARCGLPFEERFVFATDSTFHGAYDDMLATLRRKVELPTALFCGNDIIGCLKALVAEGVRVPDDVSLIGFDDLPLAAVVDPPLTTVQVSKGGNRPDGSPTSRHPNPLRGPDTSSEVLIGGKLVERQSVRLLSDLEPAPSIAARR
jgi:LacI family transcriptional regulator